MEIYDGIRLSLELDGVKAHVFRSLNHERERIEKKVQDAMEEYLTSERVNDHIDRIVENTVRAVMDEEVNRYFRYGKGRFFLRELCEEKLNEIVGERHG